MLVAFWERGDQHTRKQSWLGSMCLPDQTINIGLRSHLTASRAALL